MSEQDDIDQDNADCATELHQAKLRIEDLTTQIDSYRTMLPPLHVDCAEVVFLHRCRMENALQMLQCIDVGTLPKDAYTTRAYFDIAIRQLKDGLAGK